MLNEQQQAAFDYLFGILDKSGNGCLDKNDFSQAFQGLKKGATTHKVAKLDHAARRWFFLLCTEADENSDRKINKEEWNNWAAGLGAELDPKNMFPRTNTRFVDIVFDSISSDDESISLTEYKAWFASFGLKGNPATWFNLATDFNELLTDSANNKKISFSDFFMLLREFTNGEATKAGYKLFGDFNA